MQLEIITLFDFRVAKDFGNFLLLFLIGFFIIRLNFERHCRRGKISKVFINECYVRHTSCNSIINILDSLLGSSFSISLQWLRGNHTEPLMHLKMFKPCNSTMLWLRYVYTICKCGEKYAYGWDMYTQYVSICSFKRFLNSSWKYYWFPFTNSLLNWLGCKHWITRWISMQSNGPLHPLACNSSSTSRWILNMQNL